MIPSTVSVDYSKENHETRQRETLKSRVRSQADWYYEDFLIWPKSSKERNGPIGTACLPFS
jgi:hypothetical protein